MVRIKDLPEDQRPREKLLKHGAENLTDTELLAILIRTGTGGKSAIELADEIIKGLAQLTTLNKPL
jgi:DNA repair protein RadC